MRFKSQGIRKFMFQYEVEITLPAGTLKKKILSGPELGPKNIAKLRKYQINLTNTKW